MDATIVRCESLGNGIVRLVLNRPEKRNALSLELLKGFEDALRTIAGDSSFRVVRLEAAGPVFCAGMDLREAQEPALAEEMADRIARCVHSLYCLPQATIAVVRGAALAGGAGLMSACDFVLAAEEASFGYPEVQRGLVPALVMTLLRRQLRERDLRRLVLLGDPVGANEAQSMGLVSHVVPEADLAATAQRLGERLLRCAPGAMARTKELLNEYWPRDLSVDLELAHVAHLQARRSAEALEGMAAFFEKRSPRWCPGEAR